MYERRLGSKLIRRLLQVVAAPLQGWSRTRQVHLGGGASTSLEQLRRHAAGEAAKQAPGRAARSRGVSDGTALSTGRAGSANDCLLIPWRTSSRPTRPAPPRGRSVNASAWAHSSVNKLLRQHGLKARRRSPSPGEVERAVEFYEAGLSTRVIAEHLGFGASTITRALDKAGVTMRPKFRRVAQAALCSAARMSRATPDREP